MSDRLAYTIAEAAEALCVSPDTIRRAIKDGTLEVRYLTRRPVIPASALEAWLASAPTERRAS